MCIILLDIQYTFHRKINTTTWLHNLAHPINWHIYGVTTTKTIFSAEKVLFEMLQKQMGYKVTAGCQCVFPFMK